MKTKLECYQQLIGMITVFSLFSGLGAGMIFNNDEAFLIGAIVFSIGYCGGKYIENVRQE